MNHEIINTTNEKALLTATKETLEMVGIITGAVIATGTAPIIGKYIRIESDKLNKLIYDAAPILEPLGLEIEHMGKTCGKEGDYVSSDWGKVYRIYIGSKYHGPMLLWSLDNANGDGQGWENIISRGDHGNNYCSGGHFIMTVGKRYKTAAEALKNRKADYVEYAVQLPGYAAQIEKARMTESTDLYEAILKLTEESKPEYKRNAKGRFTK